MGGGPSITASPLPLQYLKHLIISLSLLKRFSFFLTNMFSLLTSQINSQKKNFYIYIFKYEKLRKTSDDQFNQKS